MYLSVCHAERLLSIKLRMISQFTDFCYAPITSKIIMHSVNIKKQCKYAVFKFTGTNYAMTNI